MGEKYGIEEAGLVHDQEAGPPPKVNPAPIAMDAHDPHMAPWGGSDVVKWGELNGRP